jgi:flagellar hook protein FlgE
MNSGVAIGISGIHAAEQRIAGAGHNLANQQTEGFRPLRVLQRSAREGGVEVTVERAAEPEPVDVALELVNQATGAFQAKASMRVVSTALDVLGSLVDLKV